MSPQASEKIEQYVASRAAISEDMLVEDVEKWFHAQPALESTVVVNDEGRLAGVIYRRRFLQKLAGRFGHALFGQRPILELMETEFLCVSSDDNLAEVATELAGRHNDHYYDDIIVRLQDGTHGTAPVRAVLEAVHNASARLRNDLLSIQDENTRLHNQSEVRWEMISSLSHELKTPLSTIAGYAELAELQILEPEQVRFSLTKIRGAASELLGYVNSVLEMSRAAAGRLDLSPERFDLREEIEAAAAQCVILVRNRPIRVSYSVPPDAVFVYLDRRKLRQVLVNLIGNAAKFTQMGSISLKLEIRDGAVFHLADTGPGIEEDKIPSLFERFERVGDRTVDGSGLGLSIVKALVEAEAGRIEVQSRINEGTTFSIHYPLQHEAAA